MPAKSTTDIFIQNAKKIQSSLGRQYDYSKTLYKNRREKVEIICFKHGSFWQEPKSHLRGHGCPSCGIESRTKLITKTTESCIVDFIFLFGDKYDYSKVDYKGWDKKVEIVCPKHGSFWKTPNSHLKGQGCPECAKESRKQQISIEKPKRNVSLKNTQKTTADCIAEFYIVHGDKYDYSKVHYKDSREKVEIICRNHGSFWQTPANHSQGKGCPYCNLENMKKSLNHVIADFNEVHQGKYDYSNVVYKNQFEKIEIICHKHGSFWQSPQNHMQGHGCPYCNYSHLERVISKELKTKNYSFEIQKTFDWLVSYKTNKNLYLDFYLPRKKIAIECQGEQHFKKIDFFHREPDSFNYQLEKDIIKKDLCEEHGIKILYFAKDANCINNVDYEVITDIDELITKIKSA